MAGGNLFIHHHCNHRIIKWPCVYVCVLSHVWIFVSPWTAALQALLSMGFPRQEYWTALLSPTQGDLPEPGKELMSLVFPALAGGFFNHCTTWEALNGLICYQLYSGRTLLPWALWKSKRSRNEHIVKLYLVLGVRKTNIYWYLNSYWSERGEWKSWLKAQHSENWDHGIRAHHFIGNRWGNNGNSVRLYFLGSKKSLQMVIVAMKLKDAYSLEGKLWPT